MDPVSPFMSIPLEIRAMVFNKLSQHHINMLRCVCKQLQYEVETFCTFEITTKGRTNIEALQRVLELRVAQCRLTHSFPIPLYNIINPELRGEPLTFFKRPKDVRWLRLKTNNIRFIDYQSLLQECGHFLKTLIVDFDSNVVDVFNRLKPSINFTNLTRLRISDFRGDKILPRLRIVNVENDLLLNIMENARKTSKLHSIHVTLSYDGNRGHDLVYQYTFTLFSLISEHQSSLETVFFRYENKRLENKTDVDDIFPHLIFDQDLFKDVKNLKSLTVDYSNCATPIEIISSCWEYLTSNQVQLEHLSLKNAEILFRKSFVQGVIENNFQTLKGLTLWFSKSAFADYDIDLSMIQKCVNLKVLSLHKLSRERLNAVNLLMLPESLQVQVLDFFRVNLKTTEIIEFFRRETSLEKVHIMLGGFWENEEAMGVDGFGLELMLNQPYLLDIKVNEFNYKEQRQYTQLKLVLRKFYLNPNLDLISRLELHLKRDFHEFDLSRVDPEAYNYPNLNN